MKTRSIVNRGLALRIVSGEISGPKDQMFEGFDAFDKRKENA